MSSFYKINTEPATAPVTLSDMRDWLKMDADLTADNDLITALILSATEDGEAYTGRTFVNTIFEGYIDSIRTSKYEQAKFVQLERSPLVSIASVELYIDGAYTAYTDYVLKERESFSRLLFFDTITSTDTDAAYPLKVVFTAGYGTASTVPDSIKTAIKQHVNFLYNNRGDVGPDSKKGMPVEVEALYSRFRILDTY